LIGDTFGKVGVRIHRDPSRAFQARTLIRASIGLGQFLSNDIEKTVRDRRIAVR
jgi:hypothetical protein